MTSQMKCSLIVRVLTERPNHATQKRTPQCRRASQRASMRKIRPDWATCKLGHVLKGGDIACMPRTPA